MSGDRGYGAKPVMENTSQISSRHANETETLPSFPKVSHSVFAARRRRNPLLFSVSFLSMALSLAGCGADAPKAAPQAETKPAEPAIPEDIRSASTSLLGTESQVLVFGDLAKNGKRQFLGANVIPKTPTNNLPGTIVTRVVIAEESDGKWAEVLRCDEHLKNEKGFLALTPLVPVSGWRLQYEQSEIKGLELYFTPIKGAIDSHELPIGVRWNPQTKRYQSLDRTYEHFLLESPALHDVRSSLR